MPRVAVVGNLARDRIDGGPPQPGGCPFFAALRVPRCSARSGQIVTRCADADRELFEGPVAGLGVPVTVLLRSGHVGLRPRLRGRDAHDDRHGNRRPLDPRGRGHARPGRRLGPRRSAPPQRLPAPRRSRRSAERGGAMSLDGQGLVRAPRLGPLAQDARVRPGRAGVRCRYSSSRRRRRGSSQEAVRRLDGAVARRVRDPRHARLPRRGRLGRRRADASSDDGGARRRDDRRRRRIHGRVRSARADGATPVEAARAGSGLVAGMLTARKRGS